MPRRASGKRDERSVSAVRGDRVVLATRRSPLALAQSEAVATLLRAAGRIVELLPIVTTGDRWSAQAAPGAPTPDKGVFVKELELALLDGRADLAVHSAKDLPGDLPEGLAVLAAAAREDPSDVIVGVPEVDALAPGARVGTGSPRRAAQLRTLRPDVEVVEIRGNVGTRIERLGSGEYDAIVLARAGLARLGLEPRPSARLDADQMVPAPGQGILAIEGRTDRPEALAAAAAIDDAGARLCLAVERAALRALGGGCQEPVGVLCERGDDGAHLVARGFLAQDALGTGARRARVTGGTDDPEGLGARLAEALRQ